MAAEHRRPSADVSRAPRSVGAFSRAPRRRRRRQSRRRRRGASRSRNRRDAGRRRAAHGDARSRPGRGGRSRATAVRDVPAALLAGGRDAARGCDAVLAVSDEEARVYRGLGARAVTLAPNGVDCAAYADLPTGRPHAAPTLLYVGPMSWAPNAAAVTFLAREVMPRLRSVVPDA